MIKPLNDISESLICNIGLGRMRTNLLWRVWTQHDLYTKIESDRNEFPLAYHPLGRGFCHIFIPPAKLKNLPTMTWIFISDFWFWVKKLILKNHFVLFRHPRFFLGCLDWKLTNKDWQLTNNLREKKFVLLERVIWEHIFLVLTTQVLQTWNLLLTVHKWRWCCNGK